ncbi:MAG TPA: carbohydrate-binding protein [Trebonia sp.]|nr:carbohydrate-binding protein [Trebonia sp.]
MGLIHIPRLARSRRGRPGGRRIGFVVLAVAVLTALPLTGVVHSAASAATGTPYGGTPAAVPGTVQAANYDTGGQGVAYNVTSVNGTANSYRSDGVDLEATADTVDTGVAGGAYDIGWTATGQWFHYTVNVATAGTYTVALRLSSPYGITDALHIANSSGTNLSGAVAIPNTGGYQDWATVDASVTLPAGEQTLTVEQDDNGWNFHYMAFTLTSGGGSSGDQPFGGTPAAVPGTVQAANYDTGGQGVAYNITAVNGTANSYRSDGVDLEATADTVDTGVAGGAYDLGWTAAGQWFHYTVDVASAGTYALSLRLAAPTAVTDGLHIANSAGTNLTGSITVPATGGYQDWTTVTASVTLPAGVQTLTVDQDNAGWNIHFLTFAAAGGSGEGPYGGTPAAVPGTVYAANYDTGGQGVAYNITAVNGSANSYRSDGVDLEVCSDTGCGYDIGWTAAGQWFHYTVDVATAATYTVSLRVASPGAITDALHIASSSGTNLSGDVNIPASGGYQDWETVTTSVTLPAGVQTLTVDQDNAGWNYWEMVFSTSSSGGGGSYGGFPSGFWGNTSSIPSAGSGAIEFDFINATNGAYPDSEVYWDVNGVEESIAQSPYYTMTSCNSCRIYFYLGSPGSAYQDFIELNSSGTTINADTSRVDAWGLPLAIHLHNSDGSDVVVGEDDQIFSESRSAVFTQFENSVPAAFQQLATVDAPYSIPAPGDVAAFQPGGADASYMVSYAASVGATETTQEVFGCSGGGTPNLSGDPTLCAALNRCVAQFSTTVQNTPSDYYENAPCNYYSEFWHSVAVNGLQYGFAYDDDNGQSSDFNSTDAQYVQVAIGF